MIRKFFAALVALTLVVGGLFAKDIQGVFKKFEDGKVTIEVDGKDQSFKVDEKATVKGKDGAEIKLTERLKAYKADAKVTLVVNDDNVVTGTKRGKK